MPAHLYGNGDPLNNLYNTRPIGTSPYRFKEWVRGSYVRLVRNSDYWDVPKPYADELWLTFVPDPAARAAALETGELDLAGENSGALNQYRPTHESPAFADRYAQLHYDAALTQLVFHVDNA